ncbi:Exportin-T [Galdieria sulphuraria]|nr:Exportin-T [Galdieria sulphuraria]
MIHSGKQCAQSISARIFLEIISKKMNLERKYQLLHSLNLNQFLNHLSTALKEASTNHSVEENPRTVDYLEQLGYHAFEVEIVALVNVIAAEALELMKALKRHSLSSVDISQVIEWTRNCLPIIIQCFQIEDEKMGRDTLEFFMSYINNCKDLSDDIGCTFILSIIWDQLILTEEKTLTEEKLIQLQEQRGRILTLFKNICRVYPALAMETIQNRLEQLHQVQGWDMPILEEMECIYCMTNAFVELTHKTKEWDYFVFRILSVLPKLEWFSVWSDSNAHSRQWIMEQLIIAYDNLLSHSMNLVESDMSLTYNVLIYLMDERGLRNPYSSKLRNKAASSLLRLARPLRQILATHFFELIITNLESVVLQSSQNMHASHILQLDRSDHIGLPEKLFLIEVVGIVLGSCWDSGFSSECEMRLESWLFKLITTLESCIGTQNVSLDRQDREDNKPSHGNHHASLQQEWNMSYSERVVSNSIDYLTSCWKRCFPVVFQFLQNYGSLSVTKEKCLIFLHRMVETLGEEALPFIQSSCLELIALHTNPTELTDIFLLINQIIVRLKGQARSFLFAIFQPLLQSFCHYFRSSNEYLQYFMEDPLHSRSEIWRENIELLKTFHLFVYHLVTQHLEDLLLLPTHQHFLLFCLGTLVDAVSISTHNVTVDFLRTECKYAWIVVRKLVLQPNADTLNLECTGFSLRQWITRTFVPLSLLLLFRLEWKKSNKVHLGIIEEIVEFYMACTTIPDWETCFHQSLSELPQIPSSTCQELFLVCKQQDKKTLYAFFINRLSKE